MTKYYSKSRGELIYVAEMSDVHVRRAFIKMLDDDARHEELVESERMIKTLRQDNNAYKQRISELAEENELYKEENARLKEQGNSYSPTDASKLNDAFKIVFNNNETLQDINIKLKQELQKYRNSPYAIKTFRLFSKIPNTKENEDMLNHLKQYLDKDEIKKMRWRGQCINREKYSLKEVSTDRGIDKKEHGKYLKVFIDVC